MHALSGGAGGTPDVFGAWANQLSSRVLLDGMSNPADASPDRKREQRVTPFGRIEHTGPLLASPKSTFGCSPVVLVAALSEIP